MILTSVQPSRSSRQVPERAGTVLKNKGSSDIRFLVIPFLLVWSALAFGQGWSGILDPSRAIDWTTAGVPGGVPSITTQCGSTIAPYGSAGAYASPSTINTAIQSCAAGQYVSLGSGDFYLSAGITWNAQSGVVVRGQGADLTTLHFNNVDPCGGLGAVACMIDGGYVYQDSSQVQPGQSQAADWTGGYAVGATSLTIANVGSAGIKNGQYIFLDQNLTQVFITSETESGTTVTATAAGNLPSTFQNGATLRLFNASVPGYDTMTATLSNVNQAAGTFQYTASSGLGASTGGVALVDNGKLVTCELYQLCGYAGGTSSSAGIGRNVNGSRRQIFQIVKVVSGCSSACTGAGPFTITITPGLYLAADSGMSPGIWWPNGVTSNGLENLTLDQTSVPSNSGWGGITLYDCFGCWVHGVREIDANLNHVWLFQSSQATIESSYFYGTHSGGGIESYGVESYMASNNLIQNNIFQQVSAPYADGPTEGTVFAYNYAINDPSGASSIMSAMVWSTHDVDQFSLFEGNIGSGGRSDSTFANGDFNTYFRNRFLGMDYGDSTKKTGYTYPIGLEFWNRYYNLIGNVLGISGYHNTYESSPNVCGSSCTSANTSIYVFGFSGAGAQSCANPTYCPPDNLVATTVMRWGNYDVVNASSQFNSAEVPSGLSQYANPVPSSHNLPASFYYSSPPQWWTASKAWPPIGPDVSGGNVGICSAGTYAGLACTASSQCSGGGTCASATAGEAYSNPAMDCYLNTMGGPLNGTGNALTFNGATCYPDPPGPPGPPTQLTATPQ
ncbi:MAG: hypothetical protein ABSC64_07795 [Candidatus Korobacteraceae bacterium]